MEVTYVDYNSSNPAVGATYTTYGTSTAGATYTTYGTSTGGTTNPQYVWAPDTTLVYKSTPLVSPPSTPTTLDEDGEWKLDPNRPRYEEDQDGYIEW